MTNYVDWDGDSVRNCFAHSQVFVRKCQLLPSQIMPHGSVGMGDGLFIVVLHPSFGYDHDFSVVLRPIVMMHFQPYL